MARAPRPSVRIVAPQAAASRHPSPDSTAAADVRRLLLDGDRDAARERFGDIVLSQQRRAVRIAYQYLRDVHDADEAVQTAFVKVFGSILSYKEDLPFEVWFTRILVNTCLDMRKSRARRLRWVLPMESTSGEPVVDPASTTPSAEASLLGRERLAALTAAVARLPERQRAVFLLRHFEGQSPADVGRLLGLTEATVRVHLFRAVHRLRRLLDI